MRTKIADAVSGCHVLSWEESIHTYNRDVELHGLPNTREADHIRDQISSFRKEQVQHPSSEGHSTGKPHAVLHRRHSERNPDKNHGE